MALWAKMNESDGVKAKFVPIWMVGVSHSSILKKECIFLNNIYS